MHRVSLALVVRVLCVVVVVVVVVVGVALGDGCSACDTQFAADSLANVGVDIEYSEGTSCTPWQPSVSSGESCLP